MKLIEDYKKAVLQHYKEMVRCGNYVLIKGQPEYLDTDLVVKIENGKISKDDISVILLNPRVLRIFNFPSIDCIHGIYHEVAISRSKSTYKLNPTIYIGYTLQYRGAIANMRFLYELQHFFREHFEFEFDPEKRLKKLQCLYH